MTASHETPPALPYLESLAQQAQGHPLLPALGVAVPLWVHDLYRNGGPTPADWQRLSQMGHIFAERGDVLLFGGSRPGETAELFNQLAEALALLAFLPGGVRFGRLHFEAQEILTERLGAEKAQRYLRQLRRQTSESPPARQPFPMLS
jgi:hypothetical protein